MHELFFHRQEALSERELPGYAAELGLDVARFESDRIAVPVLERVQRDVRSGIASGQVQGTPTIFIDGELHAGSYDAATLLEALSG